MEKVIIDNALVDKLLENQYLSDLNLTKATPTEVIDAYLILNSDDKIYDLKVIKGTYINFLKDNSMLGLLKTRSGYEYIATTAFGREVYQKGGYVKYLSDKAKAEQEAKAKSDEQHTALVNSAKSARSSSTASWISGIASLLAFGFSMYQSIESNKLETKVAVLESQIHQLTAQHNALAAKGLVLPLPRLDSAAIKRTR